MKPELRIGMVDSGHGLAPGQVASACRFELAGLGVQQGELLEDALGHGSAVAEAITSRAGEARLCVAQVFDQRGVTTALQVAAAIDWLLGCEVRVINLSLGLREDRPALSQACQAAVEAGVLVCASSPAQGAPVYPAAYPGVLAVTGDARCDAGQWTWLDSPQACFAACVRSADARLSGASLGCAALSGHLAAYLQQQPTASNAEVLVWLQENAHYRGVERRRGP
ncbi:peptidase S8 and S53 subtilisin kexin sedolisin [Pseudomonas sp. MYb187]|uniref:subtilisin-like serine protease QhpE n=1 Tax=Pseudomonas TaxID=286 RepID=UPI000CFB0C4E|nr:S8 family serine peptidase [Pseudomonas sp. MYb187]PRA67877.1 peptidase S8 and S53 subtilisin kexin sedolisin [Pseudomonas sp. MYb187]